MHTFFTCQLSNVVVVMRLDIHLSGCPLFAVRHPLYYMSNVYANVATLLLWVNMHTQ